MDYFEQIIAKLIEKEGKWVKQNVKINLSVAEKKLTGKPSIPRPEIDIVAYNILRNELEIWEVKSFLDSQGVKFDDISQEHKIMEGRYKILTVPEYRKIVTKRLITDWITNGLLKEEPNIIYGLAAGKIYSNDEQNIKKYFSDKGWLLKTPRDIFNGIKCLETEPYENDPFIIASKIIFR
jgi:hypothetical protein